MAGPQSSYTRDVGFKEIMLLNDQKLGFGSYGSVCKAKCDDLLCAAKILHPTLYDPIAHQQIQRELEHRLPYNRFLQECQFMSVIRHPNIVQYLGICQDPETRLPVLLMELMDDSLTHYLERSISPVLYHTQINLCHDIALALSFLHSNDIVHRDLSSNNVLLIGDIRAKVTDFGMAALADISMIPQVPKVSLTKCPGTDVYMPPEAVKEMPEYTVKSDSFSFGVLVVQILTRKFPMPGERSKTVHTIDPQFPTVQTCISETERRQNHISEIDPNHPLKPIALDCLNDNKEKRPLAQNLCSFIADLKTMPQYAESTKTLEDVTTLKSEERNREEQKIREEVRQEIAHKEREVEELQHTIQKYQQVIESQRSAIIEKDQIITAAVATQKELQLVVSQKMTKQGAGANIEQKPQHDLMVSEQSSRMCQLQITSSESKTDHSNEAIAKPQGHRSKKMIEIQPPILSDKAKPTLRSTEFMRAPCKMRRYSDAVTHNNIVCLRPAGTKHIHAYFIKSEAWKQLPDCPTDDSALAILDNHLITIGGILSGESTPTNQIFGLTGDNQNFVWKEILKPMPTKRNGVIVAFETNENALIVAGGFDEEALCIQTVEIYIRQQWQVAASLPKSFAIASSAICGDQLYMLGGQNDVFGTLTTSMFTCSVSSLLSSCQRTFQQKHVQVWNEVTSLPVKNSTCVTLGDRLLAIGGETSNYSISTAVYIYDQSANNWNIIGHTQIARERCFTALLSNNEFMVVGGVTSSASNEETDAVEICCFNGDF